MSYYVVTDNGANWSDPSTAVLSGSTTEPADDWVGRDTYLNGQVLLDFNRTVRREAQRHRIGRLVAGVEQTLLDQRFEGLPQRPQPAQRRHDHERQRNEPLVAGQHPFGPAVLLRRVGYSYDDKYYIEFTARYDMSSKFLKVRNGGFFPAVSAGWRISEENFMGDYRNKVGDLKLALRTVSTVTSRMSGSTTS